MTVFRYRANEARKFQSESDVPQGQGWTDKPITPMSEMTKSWDDDVKDFVWRSEAQAVEPKRRRRKKVGAEWQPQETS
jgi:hypothetical protein